MGKAYIIQCDDGNPCGRCKSVIGKARTYHELCYREDLGDATLVRRGIWESWRLMIRPDAEDEQVTANLIRKL